MGTFDRYDRPSSVDEGLSADEKAHLRWESGDFQSGPDRQIYGDSHHAKLIRAVVGDGSKSPLCILLAEERRQRPHTHVVKRGVEMPLGDLAGASLITKAEFCRAYSALAFANSFGVVMNVHATISWSLLGEDTEREAVARFEQFQKNFRSWAAYYSASFAVQVEGSKSPAMSVYCHEVGPKLGFHTHFLTHIPAVGLEQFKVWCHKTLGLGRPSRRRRKEGTEALKPLLIVPNGTPTLYRQWIWFKYLCKGMDVDEVVEQSGPDGLPVRLGDLIDIFPENPGVIKAKFRLHVSENIGNKARRRAKFRSLTDQGIFDVRYLYDEEGGQTAPVSQTHEKALDHEELWSALKL